ncbi:MAG TPA: hypothetical protein VN515_03740 [Terriglobales bacterium]|nr:hypothetical protein [Terriglobales bacterium]
MLKAGETAGWADLVDQEGAARKLQDMSGPRGLILVLYRGYW